MDWAEDHASDAHWQQDRDAALRARQSALAGDSAHVPRISALAAAYDTYAALQVARGYELLGRGQSVVTDRLHGHVLSLLLNLPHVVIPDRYGKVRALWETWTSSCPDARWADSPQAAVDLAATLAAVRRRTRVVEPEAL